MDGRCNDDPRHNLHGLHRRPGGGADLGGVGINMAGFVKYIPEKKTRPGRSAPLRELKVGESWFFPEHLKKNIRFYNRLYQAQKRYGYKFETMKIKNGTVVRRCE